MTKKEMLKEIKFPVLVPQSIEYTAMDYDMGRGVVKPLDYQLNIPINDAWIICIVELKGVPSFQALYKWQKKNNPENIIAWAYIKLDAPTGVVRLVEYPHLKDDKVILICDEKNKDLIIHPNK